MQTVVRDTLTMRGKVPLQQRKEERKFAVD